MRNRRSAAVALLFALSCLVSPGADIGAASSSESPLKQAELVIIDEGCGGSILAGIHVVLEPGWHLYWSNPGDAGIAPGVRWTLPPGFSAGPLRHPVPAKLIDGGLVSFGHSEEVLLLCEITPPDDRARSMEVNAAAADRSHGAQESFRNRSEGRGQREVAAILDWMACRESCLTGEAPLRARIPPTSEAPARGKRLFESWADRFPRPFEASGLTAGPWTLSRSGSNWRLEAPLSGPRAGGAVDFYPHPIDGFVIDHAGISCMDGRIVVPMTPSQGPGATPAAEFGGVLVVDGRGYELLRQVVNRNRRPTLTPSEASDPGSVSGPRFTAAEERMIGPALFDGAVPS